MFRFGSRVYSFGERDVTHIGSFRQKEVQAELMKTSEGRGRGGFTLGGGY